MEFGADHRGGRRGLVVADGGDFGLGKRRGADLAVGGDGDGDLVPQPLVLRQRAGTEEFDVVRMGADGEDFHCVFSHCFFGSVVGTRRVPTQRGRRTACAAYE